jgi:hypothetical protein
MIYKIALPLPSVARHKYPSHRPLRCEGFLCLYVRRRGWRELSLRELFHFQGDLCLFESVGLDGDGD